MFVWSEQRTSQSNVRESPCLKSADTWGISVSPAASIAAASLVWKLKVAPSSFGFLCGCRKWTSRLPASSSAQLGSHRRFPTWGADNRGSSSRAVGCSLVYYGQLLFSTEMLRRVRTWPLLVCILKLYHCTVCMHQKYAIKLSTTFIWQSAVLFDVSDALFLYWSTINLQYLLCLELFTMTFGNDAYLKLATKKHVESLCINCNRVLQKVMRKSCYVCKYLCYISQKGHHLNLNSSKNKWVWSD